MAIWSKLVCFPEMIANCLGRFCLASHTLAYLSAEDVFLGSVKFDGSPRAWFLPTSIPSDFLVPHLNMTIAFFLLR